MNRAISRRLLRIHRLSLSCQETSRGTSSRGFRPEETRNDLLLTRCTGRSVSLTCARAASKVVPYQLSDIGEGIKEVVIKEWFVQPGDTVSQFEQICEVQSDKASVTITSRYDGVVRKLYHEVDDTAQVGQPLVDIEVQGAEDELPLDSVASKAMEESSKAADDSEEPESPSARPAKVLATPVVRRMAQENNIDLNTLTGTGPQRRILKEDILNFLKSSSAEKPVKKEMEPVGAPVDSPVDIAEKTAADKVLKLTPYQKAMHKAMTASLLIPHFTYSDEVDMTQLVSLRKQMKKISEEEDVKLTFMPFLIKAASLALLQFPSLNAVYHPADEVIVHKASHNIGIALDSPHGLAVPNIKNVQCKSILEIARELNSLQVLGSKGQLSQQQLTNGTFSLSNIGNLGGTYTKPVISPPEVAIGALGKSQLVPRYDRDMNLVPRSIMAVSWSADHRVLDGATVCRFSNLWKRMVERPETMLLHLK